MNFLTPDQILILLTSLPATAITQVDAPTGRLVGPLFRRIGWKRWAPVLGLVGQPAWFYAAYTAGQAGIFLVCGAFTVVWGLGFYRLWILPRLHFLPHRLTRAYAREREAFLRRSHHYFHRKD